jgi:putative DNA primase/helicase
MNALIDVPEMVSLATASSAPPPHRLQAEMLAHFDAATCSAEMLPRVPVPPREAVVGEWFKQGDLGFIYGLRGLGKTWLAMYLARQCAEGGKVADWPVHKPRRVLYVDGEMPLDGICQRDRALSVGRAEGMYYLQHEALFHLTGQVLNLTDHTAQAAMLEKCKRDRIEILFLDNLSCLFSGLRENDADAWELVLPWLLELRRSRIAVVFIAHSGRNGSMRGTSRREDAAFWIIQLTEAEDSGEVEIGARFAARFVKNRNATEMECPPIEWRFSLPTGETNAKVTWNGLSATGDLRQWITAGLTSASEIAAEMGVSKGQVSKLAAKGIKEGWLVKVGREYALLGT